MSHSNKLTFVVTIFSILYIFHLGETKCVPRIQSSTSSSTPPEASPPQENSVPASALASSLLEAGPLEKNSPSTSPVTTPPVESPHEAEVATPSSSHPLLFGTRGIFFGGHSGAQGGGAPPTTAIKKVCATTDYPALCLSTLTPFVTNNAMRGDPMALLEAAIHAAAVETKLIIGLVEKLIDHNKNDPNMVGALNDCKDNYNDALDNYKEALDAIPSRDIGTINSMLSAAVTDYSTSDDEFTDGNSPMEEHDTRLMNMADNCLAIASLIK